MGDSRKWSLASERELAELKNLAKTALQDFWQRSAKVPFLFCFELCKGEVCIGLWFQSRFRNARGKSSFSTSTLLIDCSFSDVSLSVQPFQVRGQHCPCYRFRERVFVHFPPVLIGTTSADTWKYTSWWWLCTFVEKNTLKPALSTTVEPARFKLYHLSLARNVSQLISSLNPPAVLLPSNVSVTDGQRLALKKKVKTGEFLDGAVRTKVIQVAASDFDWKINDF